MVPVFHFDNPYMVADISSYVKIAFQNPTRWGIVFIGKLFWFAAPKRFT